MDGRCSHLGHCWGCHWLKDYFSIYPQPEIVASNFVEAANKIIEYGSQQGKE